MKRVRPAEVCRHDTTDVLHGPIRVRLELGRYGLRGVSVALSVRLLMVRTSYKNAASARLVLSGYGIAPGESASNREN
jgi:hypothetical protein